MQPEDILAEALGRLALLDEELMQLSSLDDSRAARLCELVRLRQSSIKSLVEQIHEVVPAEARRKILEELRLRTARIVRHWQDRRREWTLALAGSDTQLRQIRLFGEPAAAKALLLNRFG